MAYREKVDLASAQVTGTLSHSNGGTDVTSPGANGNVLTSNGSNWTSAAPASGGVTSVTGTANRISSTGGTTPQIDIDAAYVGQSSITTLGTVTTGTWSATAVGATKGGTGQTAVTIGDLLYGSNTNVWSRLVSGSNNDGSVLMQNNAGIPFWASFSSGTLNAKTTGAGTLFATQTNQKIGITGILFTCTAATAITVACTISIGTNSTTNNNIMAATALTGLTTLGQTLYIPITGVISSVAASTNVGYNITVAATGTSQSLIVYVLGRVIQ